ncbi:nucleotide 5'-monophosphate nucleosidase PpnN [Leucothrix mucor]|jgi:predicted Rossmann-fold nucleotide-binding protein|uniref:nucleotide 5'-monophosphate nucleosidase PpnN n=1 Tax=Leucothrix mucor TaxID=45248 RepID=UPI0003B51AE7|nr:nucleotide 5'-monophosphate nucleosidase PpnN [Leucothrix mucor]
MSQDVIDAKVSPTRHLGVLSKMEVNRLLDRSKGDVYRLYRNCSLAVLNYGDFSDDAEALMQRFADFDINIISQERGIKLELSNAPANAFVDGVMIKGVNEHLFSVLRDVVYINDVILDNPKFDLNNSDLITDAVFHIMRNADVLRPGLSPQLVVCWGGHSISRLEYDYTKEVGYQMGLRGLDICTGCGPGAMKGPMKGATVGHAKQRNVDGQYLGITEPGIIAAESPNPIVNELVIMPDIEKRLEAFVRTGHGIVVFPGGVGTAEEILYILGILLHPDNQDIPFPLVFSAPATSKDYFTQIDEFIGATLGKKAQSLYEIVIDDPVKVSRIMTEGMQEVRAYRKANGDAYYFNWMLKIDKIFQHPFEPTHENMRNLQLHKNQESHVLAGALRQMFSGIVSGNVKEDGLRAIKEHGKFEIQGDPDIMQRMDAMLTSFIAQKRMKIDSAEYVPCYTLVK